MYTVIRHPTKEGWTFKTRDDHRWIRRPSEAKFRKAYPTALDAMHYLRSRSVPWQEIVWNWAGKEIVP